MGRWEPEYDLQKFEATGTMYFDFPFLFGHLWKLFLFSHCSFHKVKVWYPFQTHAQNISHNLRIKLIEVEWSAQAQLVKYYIVKEAYSKWTKAENLAYWILGDIFASRSTVLLLECAPFSSGISNNPTSHILEEIKLKRGTQSIDEKTVCYTKTIQRQPKFSFFLMCKTSVFVWQLIYMSE